MTKPVVRQRVKRPKTRTGCRTCRGYMPHLVKAATLTCASSPPAELVTLNVMNNDHRAPIVGKRTDEVTKQMIRRNPRMTAMAFTSRERMAFDFFRLQSIYQLPGGSSKLLWERLALEMAQREPAIKHAVVALGSIHRALTADLSSPTSDHKGIDQEQYQFALAQSTMAMSKLRLYIGSKDMLSHKDTHTEIILVLSLLMFGFEAFHGQNDRVAVHLRTGIRILYDRLRQQQENHDSEKRVVIMRATALSNMDVLTQTFVRLDADMGIADNSESYLHPVCSGPVPSSFFTLEEANAHLDALAARIDDIANELTEVAGDALAEDMNLDELDPASCECLCTAASRTTDLSSYPDLITAMELLRNDMKLWMSAFANIAVTPTNEMEHLLTRIFCFHTWFTIETLRDESETEVDRFHDQFAYILTLIETYCAQSQTDSTFSSFTNPHETNRTPPAFSLGTGLVSCLCLVIAKSRSSTLRNRAIKLLQTINLTGFYNRTELVGYMQALIDVEESHAATLTGKEKNLGFECSEIPEEARIFSVEMVLVGKDDEQFTNGEAAGFVYAMRDFEDDEKFTLGTCRL
ncbi:Hypothetical protein R9X50_00513500 [Acrodontium crateriforme]|uniref:Uncharacterized protein n=1 Tax=Acrodontium crateriforme TaxID=150365 RepID=A0AAQ3R8X3_9PEZI|nr:Hypothetical protein R9X50_00513500 [Acrodontium crateriforme]